MEGRRADHIVVQYRTDICSETIFQKVFRSDRAHTGRVFRKLGTRGPTNLSLSLFLSLAGEEERNRDTAETEYGGNTTQRKSLTSIRLDGR